MRKKERKKEKTTKKKLSGRDYAAAFIYTAHFEANRSDSTRRDGCWCLIASAVSGPWA